MKRIFITGANRGIGLALAECLCKRGDHLWVTCRDLENAAALQRLVANYGDRVTVFALDVTDDTALQVMAEQLDSAGLAIDILINNAGIACPEGKSIESIRRAAMDTVFSVNATSPLLVTQALLPLLKRSPAALVVNISSILGSITLVEGVQPWFNYGYSASKAALNMITRMLAHELQSHSIGVLCLHPGWVRTDMGGSDAPLDPAACAALLLQRIDGFTPIQSGAYLDPDGHPLPW